MDQNLYILAAGLAALFALLIAIRLGGSLLMMFFVTLPFPLSLGGEAGAGNISLSDVIAAGALVTLLRRSRFHIGWVGQAVVAFLFVAGCSSIVLSDVTEVLLGLGRMGLVTIVPLVLLANAADPVAELRRGLICFCVGAVLLSFCSFFYFATGGIEASMYTLGINKNALGPIFGSAVVVIFTALLTQQLAKKQVIFVSAALLFCGAGLLLSLCRGGWVGTAAGMIVVLAFTGRVKPAMYVVIIVAPMIALLWSQLPEDRVEYATDVSTNSYVLKARFDAMDVAMSRFQKSPLLGAGIGLRRTVEPHNVFVLTLGETGVVGLTAFTVMIGAAIATQVVAMRRPGVPPGVRAIILAGFAAFAVYHVQTLIDVYWRRGAGALSWACVGMSVAVLQITSIQRPDEIRRSRPAVRRQLPVS